MQMCPSTLVRSGVDLWQSLEIEAGWPLDLVTSVALGSLRELCRSRVWGVVSNALHVTHAPQARLLFFWAF